MVIQPAACNNDIVDIIQTALEKYYLEEFGEFISSFEVEQVFDRLFSKIIYFKVKTSNKSYRLVSKTVVHHEINRPITKFDNQAVVEYNILSYLYPKFESIETCGVPKPVIVLPDIETYVMHYVDGILLTDLHKYVRMFSSTDSFNCLKDNYFFIGKWLKHFQQFTEIHYGGPEMLCGVIERCEQRLKLIEESGDKRCHTSFRSYVMDFMYSQLSKLSGMKVLVSGRHGDFTSFNILAGQNGITVIDFLGYTIEPVQVDFFKMLIFLEDEAINLSSSRKRVAVLKESFLNGYGEMPDLNEVVSLMCETMQRVVSMWGCITNETKYPHHRWQLNAKFQNHLRWVRQKVNF